jgi:murein DD-endopeptidase MepM/ murein hydrolase activator NlpD
MRRRAFLSSFVGVGTGAGLVAPWAAAQEIVRRVGSVTIRVDLSRARPGGLALARLAARGRLGAAWALLDGRRAPFFSDHGVPRALVPIDLTAEAGPATLGIGLAAHRGEQRIAVPITLGELTDAARVVAPTESQRALFARPEARHDAQRLLALLRTQSTAPVPGALRPPVGVPGRGFGEARTWTGLAHVESRIDGLGGERHRGTDYPLPVGSRVAAPGAGRVLFAGPLTLAGGTVAIDHGQGVVSVLLHLGRIDVREGDTLAAGAALGLSGDGGLAPEPLVEWRAYLHAVAVDPLLLGAVL